MPRPLSTRTLLVAGALLFVAAASSGAAFGAVKLALAEGDRVDILGSGDFLSIRVTTGRAELLIATGNDRTAFGNAYERVALAPRSQPDILLVAGSNSALNVPSDAIELFPDSTAHAIHPLHAGSTGEDNFAALAQLQPNPLRFTLDDRIAVVVESVPLGGKYDRFAWRALITREHSRIAVLSAWEHAGFFTWNDPVSVLVVAGGIVPLDDHSMRVSAIVASPSSLSPPDDRAQSPYHLVPVRPGSVATMAFVDSGIELASDDRMYRANTP